MIAYLGMLGFVVLMASPWWLVPLSNKIKAVIFKDMNDGDELC